MASIASIFILKIEFSKAKIKIEPTVKNVPKFSTPFEFRYLSNFSVPKIPNIRIKHSSTYIPFTYNGNSLLKYS